MLFHCIAMYVKYTMFSCTMLSGLGVGKKEVLWYSTLSHFPIFPFFSLFSPSLPFLCIHFLCIHFQSWESLPKPARRSGSAESFPARPDTVSGAFWVENRAPVIALLQKFSDNQTCIMIGTDPATYRYGISLQKRIDGMASSRPRKCNSSLAGSELVWHTGSLLALSEWWRWWNCLCYRALKN